MTRLAIDQSPPATLPLRFLLLAPWWAMLAGLLLAIETPGALRSRWDPATLALVHLITLGVFGNIMFGSVLQFLPAAAGVRMRGRSFGSLLPVLLNGGALALVAGLYTGWREALAASALLLPMAFGLLAAMTLPGLVAAAGQRLLRAGFTVAIGLALLTSLVGATLALAVAGRLALRLPAWVDIHASWGVLGWVVVLLATVARVVMPMFQGTASVPAAGQAAWLVSVVSGLCAGSAGCWPRARQPGWARSWPCTCWSSRWRRLAAMACAAATPASAVVELARRTGDACGGRAGAAPGTCGVLAGVLGLALALPWLMIGMLLEIVPFIGWIALHRHCGRGRQLPGVQRLLPDADKWRVLIAQLPAAGLLVGATLWPGPWLVRVAGAAWASAWLVLWLALRGVRRRADRFVATPEVPA